MATYNITITVSDAAAKVLDAFYAPDSAQTKVQEVLQTNADALITRIIDSMRVDLIERLNRATADDLVLALQLSRASEAGGTPNPATQGAAP